MKLRVLQYLSSLCLIALLMTGVYAEPDAYDKAHQAVATILFEYENGIHSFASYKVNGKGFVDITFANNIPDKLYSEILQQLEDHPDIDGVLAGKGGPSCALW